MSVVKYEQWGNGKNCSGISRSSFLKALKIELVVTVKCCKFQISD